MAVNFNAGNYGINRLQTLDLYNDVTIVKSDNNFVLPGIKYADEDAQVEIAEDIDVADINEKPAEEVKPGIIGEPREVTVGVTEAQQETIDGMVENVMNHYGAKDVLDNVLYKDENGNPKSQVITHKNEDGTYSKTVISYDENGKISKAAVTKCRDEQGESIIDGYYIDFQYNDDGTVKARPHYGWTNKDGYAREIMVYIVPFIINQDGTANLAAQFPGSHAKLL